MPMFSSTAPPFRYEAGPAEGAAVYGPRMPHATLLKFGYPASLIAEYEHWCVLLRPAQATLGALVLAAKSEARAFSLLSPQAFAELPKALGDIEAGLGRFRRYDKINYLMLMMVDPHVHFHVIPRYAQAQEHGVTSYPDKGWPGQPDLAAAVTPDTAGAEALRDDIRGVWRKG